MTAAQPKLDQDAQELKDLLDGSRKLLQPLEEPLDLDLGLHRWLSAEREEAYSDWLAWVVDQAKTPERVFKLFALDPPPDDLGECGDVEVKRERPITHGHDEREGRLDLVIQWLDRVLIVVEIKKGDAEHSDTAKQRGYIKCLEAQKFPKDRQFRLFVASSAEREEYEGFMLRRWGTICIAMRRLAIEFIKEHRTTTAAMVLALAGAVEQNLLGFSIRQPSNGALRFNPRVVEHLKAFLREA
jgi:hypothetical protein